MFDILIIGGGPAGITAGIYAKRGNKKIAVIEKLVPGGQVALIGEIENYPGFSSISGYDLSMKFFEHAQKLDVDFIFDEVVDVDLKGKIKKVICKNNQYEAKSIIIAIGSTYKELNIPGERELFGKGISYCAMCDGNFFKEQEVAVIGSGNTAVSNALYLADICKKVHLFSKSELKIDAYSEKDILAKKNIKIYKNSQVEKVLGNENVEGIQYISDGKRKICKVKGIFIAVGRFPDTKMFVNQLKLDSKGYIIVNKNLQTSVKGVFACGDVVSENIKQIVVAEGEGAIASTEAFKYLANIK